MTFFVSAYTELGDTEKAQLRQLADDGHDIEYHSTHHYFAEDATPAQHGDDAYVTDAISPRSRR